MLYNRNLISIALNQVLYRSVGGIQTNYLTIVNMNMMYIKYFLVIAILIILVILMISVITNRKSATMDKALPYFIISIIPLVWFFIIRDHSFNHAFFTYRILILTIIGLPIGFYHLFNKEIKNK